MTTDTFSRVAKSGERCAREDRLGSRFALPGNGQRNRMATSQICSREIEFAADVTKKNLSG